ncbi:hypothetical protein [Flavobacterium lacisediminis]|uniref:Uncharacterized protein n=1 Tax=Flavobacterium lacisediminis TaxID=2989705 RepID=A0ABT3EIY8_9FLAO|nr:hypothetical protein [Flavobacterium lacisediminis]MCW1148549.1 hypothetical protein [Flavobacterium lacisediminis]
MKTTTENLTEKELKKLRLIIFVLSCILFIISLTQTAYITEPADSIASHAFIAFLTGWLNFMGPGISWFANPLLIISWILLLNNKIKFSLISSFISVLFCLSFLLFNKIALDEAVNYGEILGYGTGYWFWLTSCIIALIGSILINYKEKNINLDN